MHQQTAAVDVAQEVVTESRAVARALDDARDVRHDEGCALRHVHDAEVGEERRKVVVCDLRVRLGHHRQQRALAHVREADETHIRQQLQLEQDRVALARQTGLGKARHLPRRGETSTASEAAQEPASSETSEVQPESAAPATSEAPASVAPVATSEAAPAVSEAPVSAVPVVTSEAAPAASEAPAPAAETHKVSAASTPNTYPVGQCTWGVKSLAPWAGNNWGNAKNWIASAQAAGHSVGTTPVAGAIAVWPNDGGGYGHVAYVTSASGANSIQVMESNYAGNMSIGNYRGTFDPTSSAHGGSVYYIYP